MRIDRQIQEWAKKVNEDYQRGLDSNIDDSEDESNKIHMLLEMATVGWPTIDGVEYKLSIHGVDTRDRPIPHIHLDRADDLERRKFKFEISLVDLLATGEPVLVLQKDLHNGINRTNKRRCNWNNYGRLRDGVMEYLENMLEDDAPTGSRSNLESFIMLWNKESGGDKNRLANYIKDQGVTVLNKYRTYFPQLYPPDPPKKKVVKNSHGKKYEE